MNTVENSTKTDEKELSSNEIGNLVWQELLGWLNSDESLNPDVKDAFVERSENLRLRMQAVFMEIQRRYLNMIASDVEFEEHIRRDIRDNLAFMTIKEKNESLKTLQSTNEDRLRRLEIQLAGFDFFNTVEASVQSLVENKVPKQLTKSVQALTTEKRQKLLSMLEDIVKKTNDDDSALTIIPEADNDRNS